MVGKHTVGIGCVGCLAGLLYSSIALAQVERSELGKRLRRFEQAWGEATSEKRAAAAPVMNEAVKSFFGLQLTRAAQRLDQAWNVVGDGTPPDWKRNVQPYRIDVDRVLMDTREARTVVRLKPFYSAPQPLPDELAVRILVFDSQQIVVRELAGRWADGQVGIPLEWPASATGDFQIRAIVSLGDETTELLPLQLSRLPDLALRTQKLKDWYRQHKAQVPETLRASIGDLADLLEKTAEGRWPETDYPWAEILNFAEELIGNPSQWAENTAAHCRQADGWLTLAKDRRRVPIRVRAPAQTTDSIPVLILFHGAGGSENMFFETYGAGGVVAAGLQRQWLVVAPRQGLTGLALDLQEILDELQALFPIDRQQVFLLGHSMGAAQVIHQATLHPELPRAAAVLGGGRAPRQAETLKSIPWWVAAGELDFGRPGARGFYEKLTQVSAPVIEFREYPDVEHLVIVQAALEDTFQFFDRQRSASQPK